MFRGDGISAAQGRAQRSATALCRRQEVRCREGELASTRPHPAKRVQRRSHDRPSVAGRQTAWGGGSEVCQSSAAPEVVECPDVHRQLHEIVQLADVEPDGPLVLARLFRSLSCERDASEVTEPDASES